MRAGSLVAAGRVCLAAGTLGLDGHESGDTDIWASNRGTKPKLLIVERVPASLKGSEMVRLARRRAELAQSGSRLKEVTCSAK